MHITHTHCGILATLLLQRILAQRAATIELYKELVVISARAIDVHAVGIIGIASRVEQPTE